MPFCNQLNSSCICLILKCKAVIIMGTFHLWGEMWQIPKEHQNPSWTSEFTSCSHREKSQGPVVWQGASGSARIFHGEELIPERIQPIQTLKLHFQTYTCKREVSPALHYLKARNSAAQALEGPLIVLKGSMKGNYQKIYYGEKILRDLKTEKTKDESHRFSLLPSSSFLEASTGKVWKCFWLSPKMTEDEGTQHLAQSGT